MVRLPLAGDGGDDLQILVAKAQGIAEQGRADAQQLCRGGGGVDDFIQLLLPGLVLSEDALHQVEHPKKVGLPRGEEDAAATRAPAGGQVAANAENEASGLGSGLGKPFCPADVSFPRLQGHTLPPKDRGFQAQGRDWGAYLGDGDLLQQILKHNVRAQLHRDSSLPASGKSRMK